MLFKLVGGKRIFFGKGNYVICEDKEGVGVHVVRDGVHYQIESTLEEAAKGLENVDLPAAEPPLPQAGTGEGV
jgi:c-di-GMP-binding flagellar brake protein YcgR